MEGLLSLLEFHSIHFLPSINALFSSLNFQLRGFKISAIRSQQSKTISAKKEEEEKAVLKVKEWEIGMYQHEVAMSQGIRIRRRPPSDLPAHYGGLFEFRLQNEGNTPQNILEEIVWNKDTEVAKDEIEEASGSVEEAYNAPPTGDFIGALRAARKRTGLPALMAEVKKASPSRGILRENFDPVEIAKSYEKGGAACISVLTDEKYFKGSFENLEAIRGSGVKCPLLCKEFVVDAWQIYYARIKGADAILYLLLFCLILTSNT